MTGCEPPWERLPDSVRIDVVDLSHSFGDVPVLQDVSLSVGAGEFLGLVGPNGSGKTTLLRSISGALTPDSGSVAVGGVDVHGVSSTASSRLVAVVPQDTTLSFSFPVRDVVAMGRHPHRSRFSPPTREDRAHVDRALERTRTAQFAQRRIDEVSGGERQRVVLARAIAQATPVLLLDEPTASLDVNHRVEMLELVRSLVDDGRTVVAAIHDLDIAARYCDRLAMLAGGSIHRIGAPADVLTTATLSLGFDVRATVTPNPVTGSPTVTALADEPPANLPRRVHVVGSGRVATSVLARLDSAGVEVTLGPVTRGDVVAELADALDVDAVVVDPFTPLSEGDLAAVDSSVRDADVTVLADVDVSAGNRRVLDVLDATGPLVVVEERPFSQRNGAGQSARRSYVACRERAVESTTASILGAVRRAVDDARQSQRDTPRVESDDD